MLVSPVSNKKRKKKLILELLNEDSEEGCDIKYDNNTLINENSTLIFFTPSKDD